MLDQTKQGKDTMKYALLLTMLLAACAPQEHDLGSEAGPQAGSAALDVGVNEEPLLATCSAASYCSKQKAFVNQVTGVTWTWSGACTTNNTWYGTAPGGRTGSAQAWQYISQRQFALSQAWTAIVSCDCNSTNNPTCHF